MSNIVNTIKKGLAPLKPVLSHTMSVNIQEDEYTLTKPVMTRTYTLGAGACDDPLNGGESSELQKIVDKKTTLQKEEEEGIGCNACYACVTGGSTPCIKHLE